MVVRAKDLWSLTRRQWVDAEELCAAVEDQVERRDLDYRSRLLIRDSVKALRHHWGDERVEEWLNRIPIGEEIRTISGGPWECDRGFSYLKEQVMDTTKPEAVQGFLRELGALVHRPVKIAVGGSIALILPGYLARETQDLDVVDEVPEELRNKHDALAKIQSRYRLQLAHFQQHYLPMHWQDRLHYLDDFGELTVYLVDPCDVFLSKLFSIRTKDLDDLRALKPHLDKDTLARRLKETCGSMLVAASLRERAEKNWYILYGEALPT